MADPLGCVLRGADGDDEKDLEDEDTDDDGAQENVSYQPSCPPSASTNAGDSKARKDKKRRRKRATKTRALPVPTPLRFAGTEPLKALSHAMESKGDGNTALVVALGGPTLLLRLMAARSLSQEVVGPAMHTLHLMLQLPRARDCGLAESGAVAIVDCVLALLAGSSEAGATAELLRESSSALSSALSCLTVMVRHVPPPSLVEVRALHPPHHHSEDDDTMLTHP
jgi:hypothetical protein